MFENWLSSSFYQQPELPSYSWGKSISLYKKGQALKANQLVLIGMNAAVTEALRVELFSMSWPFDQLRFTDLGNIRKDNAEFTIPLIQEIIQGKLFPIFIGGTPKDLVYSQFQAFLNFREMVNLVVLDEQVPFSLNKRKADKKYLQKIIKTRLSSLFNLGLIGTQGHFTDPAVIPWMEDRNFEYLRLGKARMDLTEVEPLLRDADLIHFNLSALKSCEAPAQIAPSPSGFFLEEACQICRYAGMSDKLRMFSIDGISTSSKPKLQATAKALAQMVWYFTEGFANRKGDYPASNKGLTEYVVDVKDQSGKITFWKSNKSGRWWLQVPAKTSRKQQRHRLIPCSYDDYIISSGGEIPDRLLRAFKRF